MATKVPIPKLGQSEETVTIENWKVKEGDVVKKGDILFEIETDKAVLEVESQFEGSLLKIVIPAGKEVPVMSIAAVIGKPGEEIPAIEQPAAPQPKEEKKKTPTGKPAQKQEKPAPASTVTESTIQPPAPQSVVPVHKPKPSPRARAFAKDFLIDLDEIAGTGGTVGRVTEKDVKKYLDESGYYDRKITPAAFNVAKKEDLKLLAITGTGENTRITLADVRDAVTEKPRNMSTMRKIIADRLTQSKQQIPHFYVTVSIDMTDLMQFRKKLKADGFPLSVNIFILKAVALSLKEYPMLNASTDGNKVSYKSKINMGVAVSLEKGLVVPVIKNADKKALDELQAEIAELAGKARDGKLLPDEMQGGTFTISNMGMLGVENFAAIINPGESAILAVSSVIPTPVVKDGEIKVRDIMKITLSADHRVVDGVDGAKFANAVREKLESIELWKQQV